MNIRNSKIVLAAVLAEAFLAVSSVLAASPKLPSWDDVQKVVDQQLNTLTNYQPGDLITRNQVDPIFDKLQRLGWTVRDRVDIVNSVPREDELMVRQLSSSAGKKFMHQTNSFPLSYDRVDRLDRIPMGPQTVDALITGPDGYKMIQYMTTSPDGHNLGRMISKDPHGADFNKPTGRIYTAEALLARIQESYEAALQNK
jgi:hypothetical protein